MTYLFPVMLRGVGTADVESFGAYLHRLAEAHGVTTGRLLAHAISWHKAVHPEFEHQLAAVRSAVGACVYIRPNNSTEQLVEILSKATGLRNLRSGTFLALKDALDRSVGTFAPWTRWCPACMKEFEESGEPAYFKLIWQLETIRHCPDHGLPLRKNCARCGSYQDGVGARWASGRCKNCERPLSDDYGAADRVDSWKRNGADLIELVEAISADPTLTFPSGGVQSVISTLFEKIWTGNQEQRFWRQLERDSLVRLCSGHRAITLETARKVAFVLSMRLPDLLAGKVAMTCDVLDPSWVDSIPEAMRPRRQRIPHDKNQVLQNFRSLLVDNQKRCNAPLPLERVAARLKVSVGYLHYHFPTMAKEVLDRYKAWKSDDQLRRRLRAHSAVLAFLTDDKYALEQKSRKHALRVLRVETGLPKNLLRETINSVFRLREQSPCPGNQQSAL